MRTPEISGVVSRLIKSIHPHYRRKSSPAAKISVSLILTFVCGAESMCVVEHVCGGVVLFYCEIEGWVRS